MDLERECTGRSSSISCGVENEGMGGTAPQLCTVKGQYRNVGFPMTLDFPVTSPLWFANVTSYKSFV